MRIYYYLDSTHISWVLSEFETFATSGKVFVGVLAIVALHFEHRYRVRELITWSVVIAYNHVDTFAVGICDSFYRFDTAVKGDN